MKVRIVLAIPYGHGEVNRARKKERGSEFMYHRICMSRTLELPLRLTFPNKPSCMASVISPPK